MLKPKPKHTQPGHSLGRARSGSVQESRQYLEDISDELLILPGKEYRAILEVSPINFGLKSEAEQEAIVAGYRAFLNSLAYPVQILVRILPFDLEKYLAGISEQLRKESAPVLLRLGADHLAFVERLSGRRNLLERRFYLVIPFSPAQSDGRQDRRLFSGFSGLSLWKTRFGRPRQRESSIAYIAAKRQLAFRAAEVSRSLGRVGVAARRLGSLELATLYYSFLCPDLARVQKLRQDLSNYTVPVVRTRPADKQDSLA